GEADFARALVGGLQRLHALFDVAIDVFQHHDGIVDHEAHRDGQRHQRKMVRSKVSSTSRTEARMFCVRSMMVLTCTEGGISARSRGMALLMASTVSITLAPGSLAIASTMPRPLVRVL